jgi:hypothetical protein
MSGHSGIALGPLSFALEKVLALIPFFANKDPFAPARSDSTMYKLSVFSQGDLMKTCSNHERNQANGNL